MITNPFLGTNAVSSCTIAANSAFIYLDTITMLVFRISSTTYLRKCARAAGTPAKSSFSMNFLVPKQ